jgi:hypothetical protein
MCLPVGLGYDDKDKFILDPNAHEQQSLRLVFEAFGRSVWAAVKCMWERKLLFPKRLSFGPGEDDLLWVELYCPDLEPRLRFNLDLL